VNVYLDSSVLELIYLVRWKELRFALVYSISSNVRFVFQALKTGSEVANDARKTSSSSLQKTHVWLSVQPASQITEIQEENVSLMVALVMSSLTSNSLLMTHSGHSLDLMADLKLLSYQYCTQYFYLTADCTSMELMTS